MDVTTISNNVLGGASQAMDSGVWCNASVSDGAQQWCISWKCWIPCCFYNGVVADCAVVVNSWLLYSGDWSPTMRWGGYLELHNHYVRVEFPSYGFIIVIELRWSSPVFCENKSE
jgi:hypothetical protein